MRWHIMDNGPILNMLIVILQVNLMKGLSAFIHAHNLCWYNDGHYFWQTNDKKDLENENQVPV